LERPTAVPHPSPEKKKKANQSPQTQPPPPRARSTTIGPSTPRPRESSSSPTVSGEATCNVSYASLLNPRSSRCRPIRPPRPRRRWIDLLHSRKLPVYGRDTMRRLFASGVLVSGLSGLSAQIGLSNLLPPTTFRLLQLQFNRMDCLANLVPH
jgi:hypothetical protein